MTLFSADVGIWVLAWQLGRQSKNAIKQNQRNEALKLKVQIYESVVEISSAAQQAVLELLVPLQSAAGRIRLPDA